MLPTRVYQRSGIQIRTSGGKFPPNLGIVNFGGGLQYLRKNWRADLAYLTILDIDDNIL